MQVGQRVFTCATTPPPSGSFFSVFVDKVVEQNAVADYFFRMINHSLVCQRCHELGVAHKCVHKLGLIPPWKSLLRFTQMKRLVPAKRMNDYEAEVYGVIRPEGSKYFPGKIVDAIIIKRKVIERCVLPQHPVVYISIDPASHLRSTMGLSAISYGTEGQVVVIGLAAVQVAKCEILQVQMVVSSFVDKVCKHPWFQGVNARARIVPIIECNNNEIVANSILSAIKGSAIHGNIRLLMPFTKAYFSTGITDNLGVCNLFCMKHIACCYFKYICVHSRYGLPTLTNWHQFKIYIPSSWMHAYSLLNEALQLGNHSKRVLHCRHTIPCVNFLQPN